MVCRKLRRLVTQVAHAREHHSYTTHVSLINHFLAAHGAAVATGVAASDLKGSDQKLGRLRDGSRSRRVDEKNR